MSNIQRRDFLKNTAALAAGVSGALAATHPAEAENPGAKGTTMTDIRVENDSLGAVNVPADKLWGAQTQRSLEHFSIGDDLMPREMIPAYAFVKKAAALVNDKDGRLGDTSKVAHYALDHDLTLKEAALQLGAVSASEFDRIVDPSKMVHPYVAVN